MAAIWRNDGSGWKLLERAGFPDEATLHGLIEEAPQLLPLAGAPELVVVGREVQLGNGFADLLAVEASGRVAIIEIKLARNSEARRAVIAQVLTYAAYLDGMELERFERDIVGRHLRTRGFESLSAAMGSHDQTGAFDAIPFADELRSSMREGRFRLVIVLDAAPDELTRLVGYLSKVADKLLIDLVTVSSYEVNGSTILVPQRVEPERSEPSAGTLPLKSRSEELSDGADAFEKAIEAAPEPRKAELHRLASWARALEREGLVKLSSYNGITRQTLLPRLHQGNVGLATVSSEGTVWVFRRVFERLAPRALTKLEAAIAPTEVRQGSTLRAVSDDVLAIITDGYREAVASSRGTAGTGGGSALFEVVGSPPLTVDVRLS